MQSNFILGSVMEFMRIWQSRQEASFNLRCEDGELKVNFDVSLKIPKKQLSPSKIKRNNESEGPCSPPAPD